MSINHIAVIGAGTMGRGIAEAAASHGLCVNVCETNVEQRQTAESKIRTSVEKAIRRGKISAGNPDEILERIDWHAEIEPAAAEAQLIIEAVAENEDLKRTIFQRLDEICNPEVILASNTSSISITRLAATTGRPENVVGMHFFNPVPIMQPVEIVRGVRTSDDTIERTAELAAQMGKRAFTVADSPGFAVNRILMPLINEAVFALQEGVAERETIDALMKLGCNHPMGPLELADLVGLDVCLSIMQVLHRELGDPKFRPCPMLVRMVNAGQLGRKSGEGFYRY